MATFFVQIAALITPIFFQLVIDKVLVHQGLSTLHVLVIGLAVVSLFETFLGGLRAYVLAHTAAKVVPVGQVKVIEPLITGTTKTIHATQGQQVAEGDILVTLDPTEPAADRAKLEEDFLTSQVISARLNTTIAAAGTDMAVEAAELPAITGAPVAVIDLQRHMLRQTLMAFNAEQQTIAADIRQRREELKRIEQTVAERQKLIGLLGERVGMVEDLSRTGSASRAMYLESAQLLFQQRAELAEDQGQIPEIGAAILKVKDEALKER